MWWTLECNYYIPSLVLFGGSKPSRVNPVTQMHKTRPVTKQEQQRPPVSGGAGEQDRSVRIRAGNRDQGQTQPSGPSVMRQLQLDKQPVGLVQAQVWRPELSADTTATGLQSNMGKMILNPQQQLPRESRGRPSLLVFFMVLLGSEEADLELSP